LHGQGERIIPSEYFPPCALSWQPQQHCRNQFSGIESATKVITKHRKLGSIDMNTGRTEWKLTGFKDVTSISDCNTMQNATQQQQTFISTEI